MTWLWLALAGLALAALLLLVALSRLRRRTTLSVEAARAESAELRDRLDRLEREHAEAARQPVVEEREYTITRVGQAADVDAAQPPAPVLPRAVFADLVARESVIRIGSLAHGLRRALDPETRNRIRFEMRREVKRARKRRRTEQREAYRARQAHDRDALRDAG